MDTLAQVEDFKVFSHKGPACNKAQGMSRYDCWDHQICEEGKGEVAWGSLMAKLEGEFRYSNIRSETVLFP